MYFVSILPHLCLNLNVETCSELAVICIGMGLISSFAESHAAYLQEESKQISHDYNRDKKKIVQYCHRNITVFLPLLCILFSSNKK